MSRARTLANYGGTDLATQVELDAVAATTYDDVGIRQDITTLALREAIAENRSTLNLPNSVIEIFEDSTGMSLTDITLDTTNEFFATSSTPGAAVPFEDDSNTMLLLHMDESPFVDSSSKEHSLSTVATTRSTTRKFGTHSAYFAGVATSENAIYPGSSDDFKFGTGDWTWEFWMQIEGTGTSQTVIAYHPFSYNNLQVHKGGASTVNFYVGDTESPWDPVHGGVLAVLAASEFSHIAIVRDNDTIRGYVNGEEKSDHSCSGWTHTQNYVFIGNNTSLNEYKGWVDEVRCSDICRYPDGTTFVPNEGPMPTTGTLISAANAVASNKTKVSGVMLYKNAYGTATLGTELKIYFTCNGDAGESTVWTEVLAADMTLVTPEFSDGVKMVKLAEKTCTEGDDIRYKAVWADQLTSTRVVELHGIGLNY